MVRFPPDAVVQLYPALDLSGGQLARAPGWGPQPIYPVDPVAAAERLLSEGASWLHVVDLDRVYGAGRDNDALVRRIARLPGARVQMGGLLAEVDHLRRAFDLGASRAVVATSAAADAERLRAIARSFEPGRLAVALDVRQGRLVVRGTGQLLALAPGELARRAAAHGIGVVVYRDVDRDGALAGPDLEGARAVLGGGYQVLVAGGVGSTAHLLAARQAGLHGVIVGRALYQGLFSVRDALACLA